MTSVFGACSPPAARGGRATVAAIAQAIDAPEHRARGASPAFDACSPSMVSTSSASTRMTSRLTTGCWRSSSASAETKTRERDQSRAQTRDRRRSSPRHRSSAWPRRPCCRHGAVRGRNRRGTREGCWWSRDVPRRSEGSTAAGRRSSSAGWPSGRGARASQRARSRSRRPRRRCTATRRCTGVSSNASLRPSRTTAPCGACSMRGSTRSTRTCLAEGAGARATSQHSRRGATTSSRHAWAKSVAALPLRAALRAYRSALADGRTGRGGRSPGVAWRPAARRRPRQASSWNPRGHGPRRGARLPAGPSVVLRDSGLPGSCSCSTRSRRSSACGATCASARSTRCDS